MGKGLWTHMWVRHIAVALSYGLAVLLCREISISQWMVLAGLRLSVLLLVPYRYWAALFVGEAAYFVVLGYVCAGTWGDVWGFACAIPGFVYVAPIIYWVRERWSPIEKKTINMGRFLGCALLASVAVTFRDLGVFSVIKNLPVGYIVDYKKFGSDYFIGNYLGILTVAPLVLLAYQVASGENLRLLAKTISRNRLLLESVFLVIPVMAFLLWVGAVASPHAESRRVIQIAMFLPVVWLATRFGWQGAAVGGAAASCAVMALMPGYYDYATTEAEVVVAFAISTMLLMGGRIASLDDSVIQERNDLRMAIALAQRNVYVGEMQLRMTSQALEQVRETVQSSFTLMMTRLRHLQPAVDEIGYQRDAKSAQKQLSSLADSLYPTALRERGLPNALRNGALARALDEVGLPYSCELRGPVSALSHTLRMMVYRIIWDAVTDACLKKDISGVRVRVRGWENNGRKGAAILIGFSVDHEKAGSIHWEELLSSLMRASSGMGLQAIHDRTAIFEGHARTRLSSTGRYISAYLLDPTLSGGE